MVTSLLPSSKDYDVYAPARERNQPPPLHYVLSLFEAYRPYYLPFHNQCATEEAYYFGRRAIPHPEGHDPTWTASPRAIVDTASDHVDIRNFAISVPEPSLSARARAERLQQFYTAAWSNLKGPVLRTAVKHGFLYGLAWLKPMFNGDMWPDAPRFSDYFIFSPDGKTYVGDARAYRDTIRDFMERRSLTFPLAVYNVNPKNLIWDDSRVGPKWAIEFYTVQSDAVAAKYPQWYGKHGLISWLEYWDDRWFGYIADNQWVLGPYEHGYGFLPYVPVLPAHSLDWDQGLPEYRYQGILAPVHSLLDAESRILTALEAIVRTFGWRNVDFFGDGPAVDMAMEDYSFFGGPNKIPRGVEIKPSPVPQPPGELWQQLNVVQNLIEAATFPNVVRGVRPRGVSAGFALSVLAGMGRVKFAGMADAMAHAIEGVNSSWALLVQNKIRGRVTAHARSEIHSFDAAIGPDDIRGLIENIVLLKAEAPEEREREALLGLRLYMAGIISQYEAMRRAGVVKPLDEMIQIEAEQLSKMPELMAEKARIAAQGVGLLTQLAEAAGTPLGRRFSPPVERQSPFGNQFMGLGGEQRVGERNIQQGRVASREGRPSVFPQGMNDMDIIARLLGNAPGGAVGVPSGQVV